jgi:hypothetical protein
VLLSLFALAVIVILAGIYLSVLPGPMASDSTASGHGELAGRQIEEAKRLAINNDLFASVFNSPQISDDHKIGSVTRTAFKEYGYRNVSGTFVDVPIQLGESAPMRRDLISTVDLDAKKVMAEKMTYSESLMGHSILAVIPPDSYFYKAYGDNVSYLFYNYYMMANTVVANWNADLGVHQGDAVEVMFLDADNFRSFINGSAYDSLEHVNYPNNTTYMKGMEPLRGNWSAYIPRLHNGFYIVIKNSGHSRDAIIHLNDRPVPFIW